MVELIDGHTLRVYAVIKADGTVKRTKGRGLAVYASRPHAQAQASSDGDSVVEVDIELRRKPIFIRNQVIEDE